MGDKYEMKGCEMPVAFVDRAKIQAAGVLRIIVTNSSCRGVVQSDSQTDAATGKCTDVLEGNEKGQEIAAP